MKIYNQYFGMYQDSVSQDNIKTNDDRFALFRKEVNYVASVLKPNNMKLYHDYAQDVIESLMFSLRTDYTTSSTVRLLLQYNEKNMNMFKRNTGTTHGALNAYKKFDTVIDDEFDISARTIKRNANIYNNVDNL